MNDEYGGAIWRMMRQIGGFTKKYALRIIELYQTLPRSGEAQVIGNQVLRSGTSVGAQYREACRAKSPADFINKIVIFVSSVKTAKSNRQ